MKMTPGSSPTPDSQTTKKCNHDLGDLYIEMIICTELMIRLSPKKCLAQS
jgi:hypothetical protein